MTEETKQEVAPATGTAVALTPEEIAMMAGDAGKQTFTMRELMVPVLKVANTSGDIMKRSSGEYIEGIQEGDLVDTLTRIPMKGPLQVIIARFETTYIEAKPKMGPTVKLWGTDPTGYQRAVGGDVGVRVTQEGNEIREVGSYYTLLIKPDGSTLPCIFYMGSTAWGEARRLNALLASYEIMGPTGPFVAPPYARTFMMTTVPASNEKNSWMAMHFDLGPLTLGIMPKERGQYLYKRAKEIEEAVDKRLTRIHGTADDDRFAEGQAQRRQGGSGNGSGPPQDNAPPPTGEGDYGASPGRQGASQAEIVEKARDAPF